MKSSDTLKYVANIASALISLAPKPEITGLESKVQYHGIIQHNPDIDYNSGARIRRVSLSQLPPGVLGFYNPSSHTITAVQGLGSYIDNFVMQHESGHARGLLDEQKTDSYASSQAGYNLRQLASEPLVLGR